MSNLPAIGERFQNKTGHWFTVTEVNNCLDITIKFDHKNFTRKTKSQYIRDGSIKLPSLFIGDILKDKIGNIVTILDIDTTSRVTFRWEDGYTRVCQASVIKSGTLMREENSQRLNPSVKVGDIFVNCQGSEMTVEKYTNSQNIIISFTTPVQHSVRTTTGNLKKGNVHNKYLPTVAGVGVIGDFKIDVKSKMYRTWVGMLKRVYTPRSTTEKVTYGDCSVQKEWFEIKNFALWFNKQILKDDWHLDKDLLVLGNKMYGENTCIFLPREVNTFLTDRHNHRGDWPIGVTYHERLNKWQSTCNFDGISNYLGVFEDPLVAFEVYKKFKEGCSKILASRWEGLIDKRGISALLNYKVDISK